MVLLSKIRIFKVDINYFEFSLYFIDKNLDKYE